MSITVTVFVDDDEYEATCDYYDPGRPATWEDPPEPAEVGLSSLKLNGEEVLDDISSDLLDQIEQKVHETYLEDLAEAKAEYEMECRRSYSDDDY